MTGKYLRVNFTDKSKYIIKLVEESLIKLIWSLTDKCSKITDYKIREYTRKEGSITLKAKCGGGAKILSFRMHSNLST